MYMHDIGFIPPKKSAADKQGVARMAAKQRAPPFGNSTRACRRQGWSQGRHDGTFGHSGQRVAGDCWCTVVAWVRQTDRQTDGRTDHNIA